VQWLLLQNLQTANIITVMADPCYINDIDALVSAAFGGQMEIVTRLLASGADVNCQNEHSETALHMAAQEGYEFIAEALLKAGADPNKANAEGDTPWDYAVYYEHKGIQAVLEQGGAIRQSRLSARELAQREIDSSFSHANAVKTLSKMIRENRSPNAE